MQFDVNQRKALATLKPGSILVGGTGSGKSRTGLAYFFIKECGGSIEIDDDPNTSYSEMTRPKDLYIITTAAKRDKREWEQELLPFMLSTDRDKCVNHILIVIDSWNNISKYINIKDSFFIFDEQRVVGSGKWSKSFIKIAKNNNWILLTATPGDVWKDYIPVFIANGFYKNRTEFYTRHVIWSRYTTYPKIDRYIETDRLEKLRDAIQIRMDVERKTKPHRIYITTDYNKDDYKKVSKDFWNIYENVPIENPPQYISCLRRVVNDKSKLKKVKEIFKIYKRLIIFYNFDYELEDLRSLAKELEVKIGEWNGHVHTKVPEGDEWLYLVQYNAGAEGWNCVTTNTIVFFSLNYSYRLTHQAAGRIDRRNTEYTDLYYFYLYTDSTMDKNILEALEKKKDFNEKEFYKKMTS